MDRLVRSKVNSFKILAAGKMLCKEKVNVLLCFGGTVCCFDGNGMRIQQRDYPTAFQVINL